MSKTAQALVLDFGGVVSRTIFETQPENERVLGLSPGALGWRGPFDPCGDPLWRAMQAGEISERDYYFARARETGRLVGEDWTSLPQFLQRIRGADPQSAIRPEAIATIEVVKKTGAKLAILSNELDLFYGPDFRSKLSFLADIDLIVDATYTGILKPDPRAYAFVTDGLMLTSGVCVFVDDQIKNIRGARQAGFRTIHFDVRRPAESYQAVLEHFGL